jgi:hypothetical protein
LVVIVSLSILPMDTLDRADLYSLFDLFFRAALGIDNLGLFDTVQEHEYLRAEIYTTATTDAVLDFYNR